MRVKNDKGNWICLNPLYPTLKSEKEYQTVPFRERGFVPRLHGKVVKSKGLPHDVSSTVSDSFKCSDDASRPSWLRYDEIQEIVDKDNSMLFLKKNLLETEMRHYNEIDNTEDLRIVYFYEN